ncbi:MAG: hypothetical protein QXN83_08235 [Nitrososphaerales archaeon]
MPLEKDIEWFIRDLIYRKHDAETTIKAADITALLQKSYECKSASISELSALTDKTLTRLTNVGILALAQNESKLYRINSIPNRYQCIECDQISYIGAREDVKCFSCESVNLRERNVR